MIEHKNSFSRSHINIWIPLETQNIQLTYYTRLFFFLSLLLKSLQKRPNTFNASGAGQNHRWKMEKWVIPCQHTHKHTHHGLTML